MTTTLAAPDRARTSLQFRALGTTARITVSCPAALPPAGQVLRTEIAAIDAACSRFRDDSEITRLHAQAGRPVAVSDLLFAALEVAVRAARQTDGLVDPTVGDAVCALGYDRDFAQVVALPRQAAAPRPAPGWWRLHLDPDRQRVLLPRGVRLDLGATAKALAADRIAAHAAAATGAGVLVSLGGDVATAGRAPRDGWRIGVGDAHERALTTPDTVVAVTGGGLATSATTVRTWRAGDRTVHHVVDPRTGDVAAPRWRAVTVAAASCVAANTASTAALVLGDAAPDWLDRHRLPARLVDLDGGVHTVAGFGDT